MVTLPEDPQHTNVTPAVAPSDMIYYPNYGIPEFINSLLVTTLKSNSLFKACVYALKLNAAGTALDMTDPYPKVYFEVPDEATKLRYRDRGKAGHTGNIQNIRWGVLF